MNNLKAMILSVVLCLSGLVALAQEDQTIDPKLTELWKPVPEVVTPGVGTAPPSDAIVLFDGKDLDAWAGQDGGAAKWTVADGAVTVAPGTGTIHTKKKFGDIQLHIEWRTPSVVKGEGQGRGNSGIFLMGRYELQVLDSYNSSTYVNGQAGSIYKQSIPLVNACKPPGEWQTYDVIFMAPEFTDKGTLKTPARITVLQNGVLPRTILRYKAPQATTNCPGTKPTAKIHLCSKTTTTQIATAIFG